MQALNWLFFLLGFSNPCRVLNGGCEDLCRLEADGRQYCACNAGRILLSDGKRCAVKMAINCTQTEFRCSDYGCIPYHMTCDGVSHCTDQSDEDQTYCGELYLYIIVICNINTV